jgi:uncharacterized membrane protein (DUF4010 family)
MKSTTGMEFNQNGMVALPALPTGQWHPTLIAGGPRVWAVLMLMLVLSLALFTKVFRSGGQCGWTTGGEAHSEPSCEVWPDFAIH